MHTGILYAMVVLIWGSTWFAIKFQLGFVDPLMSISYRFFLASALMFIYSHLKGRLRIHKFRREQFIYIALQGFLLFFLNYWLFYLATEHLVSGLVPVCGSLIIVMNIINQRLFFLIPVRKPVVAGSLLGLIGIGCVFWPEISSVKADGHIILGGVFCIVATYSASLGNMISMRNTRDTMPVLETNAYAMAVGAGFSLIAAFLSGAQPSFDFSFPYIASLAYLTLFGSVAAFLSYLTLIARIGADRAAYTAVIFPVIALLISTVLEDYDWTAQAFSGIFFVILGNIIALARFNISLFKKNTADNPRREDR